MLSFIIILHKLKQKQIKKKNVLGVCSQKEETILFFHKLIIKTIQSDKTNTLTPSLHCTHLICKSSKLFLLFLEYSFVDMDEHFSGKLFFSLSIPSKRIRFFYANIFSTSPWKKKRKKTIFKHILFSDKILDIDDTKLHIHFDNIYWSTVTYTHTLTFLCNFHLFNNFKRTRNDYYDLNVNYEQKYWGFLHQIETIIWCQVLDREFHSHSIHPKFTFDIIMEIAWIWLKSVRFLLLNHWIDLDQIKTKWISKKLKKISKKSNIIGEREGTKRKPMKIKNLLTQKLQFTSSNWHFSKKHNRFWLFSKAPQIYITLLQNTGHILFKSTPNIIPNYTVFYGMIALIDTLLSMILWILIENTNKMTNKNKIA